MPVIACSNDRVWALRDAILDRVHENNDPDQDSYCTLADLEDLEEEYDCSVVDEVRELIQVGKIWVPKPFGLVECDTSILPITWRPGLSTAADITAEFGDPHLSATADESKVLTYDVYVEDVDKGYPLPPAPYAARNAQDGNRPGGYTFPYTGIWPPEALQVEFTFDHAGKLVSHEFKVGSRLT
jgi:hypothetical protein